MTIKEAEDRAKNKMEKTLEALANDFASLKAGRANPRMLDKISADYYGAATPLSQMAVIAAPEPRVITVTPWDPSTIKTIEKAILASDLGINPSNDGKMIRLVVPALTEERRRDLVKLVGKSAEEAKVAMRNIRRTHMDELKKLEKAKEITEDDQKLSEKAIQKTLDEYIKKVDEAAKIKEKEIMTV